MFKAYKYRIYPNKQQEQQIQKTFGCCRFVYNQILAFCKEIYETEHKTLNPYDCQDYLYKVMKPQYEWLKEVDKFSIELSAKAVGDAYVNFFNKRAGKPKFKAKHNKVQSYSTANSRRKQWNTIEILPSENKIKLPKLKKVKAKISYIPEGTIKRATIIKDNLNKYFVTIFVEIKDDSNFILPTIDTKVGIDLGVKTFLTQSNGIKIENPNIMQKYQRKLKREQRKFKKKKPNSKNQEKQRLRLAKVYKKIKNSNKDFLNKVSWQLIKENQIIVSETLGITEMLQNSSSTLAEHIFYLSFYSFCVQLSYKSQWYGRTYIKIDRFFPSSQLCSNCGYRTYATKNLNTREWICPNCNTKHDRDINAAKNILNEGLNLLLEQK